MTTRKLYFTGLKTYDFPQTNKKTKRPILCELEEFSASDIKSIESGPHHAIFLLRTGEVYVVGKNEHSQLGFPLEKQFPSLQRLTFPEDQKCLQVSTYDSISVFLTEQKRIYTAGYFAEKSELNSHRLKELKVDFECIQVICGDKRCYFVTSDNEVFAFGDNSYGVLGTESGNKFLDKPEKITFPIDISKISKVCCGKEHTIILTEDSKVFGIGSDLLGQIGLLKKKGYPKATLVTSLSPKHIMNVTCGYYHTVYVSKKNQIFVTGKNNFGQLGLGHTRDMSTPTQIFPYRFTRSAVLMDAVCGYNHTFFREKKRVYACGKNKYGQLGVGSFLKPYQPCEVIGSSDVRYISSSEDNTWLIRKVKINKKRLSKIGSSKTFTSSEKKPKRKKNLLRASTPSFALKGATVGSPKLSDAVRNANKTRRGSEIQLSKKVKECQREIKNLKQAERELLNKIDEVENENDKLIEENQRLRAQIGAEAENPQKKDFYKKVVDLRKKLNWKIDLHVKHRNFAKCQELQVVLDQIPNDIEYNPEAEKLLKSIEEAKFLLE